jgi:type II secretory pathway component PulJ
MIFIKSFGFVLLCVVLAIVFAAMSLAVAAVFFVIGSIAAVRYAKDNSTEVRIR